MLAMQGFRHLLRKELVFALLGATATVGLVATPYRIALTGFLPELLAQTAIAKDGNDGKGSGSESDGGDNDKGDGGKSGQHGGHGQPSKSNNPGDEFGPGSKEYVSPATGNKIRLKGSNIEVMHPDGIKEEILNGRYEMNDAKGRTIIKRPVTGSDRARLHRMIGR
jgi:hypothetical protein